MGGVVWGWAFANWSPLPLGEGRLDLPSPPAPLPKGEGEVGFSVMPSRGSGADGFFEGWSAAEVGMGLVGAVVAAVVGAVELIVGVDPADDFQQLGLG